MEKPIIKYRLKFREGGRRLKLRGVVTLETIIRAQEEFIAQVDRIQKIKSAPMQLSEFRTAGYRYIDDILGNENSARFLGLYGYELLRAIPALQEALMKHVIPKVYTSSLERAAAARGLL